MVKPSLEQVFQAAKVISRMREVGVVFKKGDPRVINGVLCGIQSPSMEEIRERFWCKANKNGPIPDRAKYPHIGTPCWMWKGPVDGNGYGAAIINKFRFSSNRVAFALGYDDFLPGLQACHHCDTPLCVNPDHLFAGTNRENHMDCIQKGRGNRRVLSEEQVVHIRRSSKSCEQLSRELGVSNEAVRQAAVGENYQSVTEPVRKFVTRKLNPDLVRYIRSSPKPNIELAKELDVTNVLISQVRLRKAWRGV